jgi:hypothetical protein
MIKDFVSSGQLVFPEFVPQLACLFSWNGTRSGPTAVVERGYDDSSKFERWFFRDGGWVSGKDNLRLLSYRSRLEMVLVTGKPGCSSSARVPRAKEINRLHPLPPSILSSWDDMMGAVPQIEFLIHTF